MILAVVGLMATTVIYLQRDPGDYFDRAVYILVQHLIDVICVSSVMYIFITSAVADKYRVMSILVFVWYFCYALIPLNKIYDD